MKKRNNQWSIKEVASIAMFCALAFVCMLTVRITVKFLTLDIKDSIIVLCGLLFGPAASLAVSTIVPLLELITISTTGPYGFIMNFLSSTAFSVTASLIYKKKKTFSGAIAGLLAGILAVTATMMLANLIITPRYMEISTEAVVALIPTLLLPFNFVKATLNAAIVLMFYKPLSNIFKRAGIIAYREEEHINKPKGFSWRSFAVFAAALVIIAISLAVIFFVLRV